MATIEEQSVAVEQVLDGWREQGIRNVRFELPDMHGTSRSKIVPIENAAGFAREGLNMYGGTVVLASRSDVVPGTLYNEEVAYADQRLYPDPSTAAIVPWLEATGRFICDAKWAGGKPLAASPRHVFARVLERSRQLGYDPVMGMEPEFYLLDAETRKPLFEGYQIFNSVRNTWVPAIERIVGEMREYGIDIITANCEYAGSQWEINYAPGRGMAGPDIAFSFKNGVKEIARKEGLLASFMSKPFAGGAGCGAACWSARTSSSSRPRRPRRRKRTSRNPSCRPPSRNHCSSSRTTKRSRRCWGVSSSRRTPSCAGTSCSGSRTT